MLIVIAIANFGYMQDVRRPQ